MAKKDIEEQAPETTPQDKKIAALETANAELQAALEDARKDGVITEEEKAKIAALEKVVEQQATALHQATTELEALKKAQAAAAKKEATAPKKKPTIPTDPFTVAGKKYLLNAFRFNIKIGKDRKTITAEEAYHDEALLQEIVANWPTLVTEVK